MALQLNLDTKSGVTATYHRISVIARQLNDDMAVSIDSYLSKDAREAGKDLLLTTRTLIPASSIDLTKPLLDQLYAALKQTTTFTGATDV